MIKFHAFLPGACTQQQPTLNPQIYPLLILPENRSYCSHSKGYSTMYSTGKVLKSMFKAAFKGKLVKPIFFLE